MENNKTYTRIELEGGSFYRDIKRIEFIPLKMLEEMKAAVPKGKIYFWKLFGLIPFIPLRAKCDLYKAHRLICRFGKLNDAVEAKYGYINYFIKGNTVYSKAKVNIYCTSNSNVYKSFNTNDEAMKYFNEIKDKCKIYENYLT